MQCFLKYICPPSAKMYDKIYGQLIEWTNIIIRYIKVYSELWKP